jgi:hypothetical protein
LVTQDDSWPQQKEVWHLQGVGLKEEDIKKTQLLDNWFIVG